MLDAACALLAAAAGDRRLEIEVVVLASERRTKFSRHVVLRPHWTDGPRRPAPLPGSRTAGMLATAVRSVLGAELRIETTTTGKVGNFVDASVYSRDRCFRVAGSTKLGDDVRAAFAVCDRRVWRSNGGTTAAWVDGRPSAAALSVRATLVVPELPDDFLPASDCIAL